jgi:AcrR family transcriptional regulator
VTVQQGRNAARTRERILEAAGREFGRAGFSATTVRTIADTAGVSPNLITRYFGGKDGLFVAASHVRLGVADMFAGPRESLGARMAETVLARWSALGAADPMLGLLRSAGERRAAASMLAEFLDRESLDPLRAQLEQYGMPSDEAASRAASVDVFMLGVTARFRLLRDDLDSLERSRSWLAGSIQALVDGPYDAGSVIDTPSL